MTRRRKLLVLSVFLLAVPTLPVLVCYGYWGAVGLMRREPFLDGLPVSYWRGVALRWKPTLGELPRWAEHCPAFVQQFLRERQHTAPLRGAVGDLPFLFALYRDPDGTVRHYAYMGIRAASGGADAIPTLRTALRDTDAWLRCVAAERLEELHDDLALRVPVYADFLSSTDEELRTRGLLCLRALGPMGRGAAPAVLRLMREGDTDGPPGNTERDDARVVLEAIDPELARRVRAEPDMRP